MRCGTGSNPFMLLLLLPPADIVTIFSGSDHNCYLAASLDNLRDRFCYPQIREAEPGWNAISPIDLDPSTAEDASTVRIRTSMPRRRKPKKRPPQSILDKLPSDRLPLLIWKISLHKPDLLRRPLLQLDLLHRLLPPDHPPLLRTSDDHVCV
ncbi:hypothetical protein ACLOJK_022544 [Asimina triloba]